MTQIYEPVQRDNRRNRRVPLTVLAAVAAAGGIIATVFLITDSDGTLAAAQGAEFEVPRPLADASTTCDAGTLMDEDQTLVVDMAGDDPGSGTDTIDDVGCVLNELDTPQAVVARMDSTRALDGMQSATWSTYEVTWNYHPDDGLDLIITTAG